MRDALCCLGAFIGALLWFRACSEFIAGDKALAACLAIVAHTLTGHIPWRAPKEGE